MLPSDSEASNSQLPARFLSPKVRPRRILVAFPCAALLGLLCVLYGYLWEARWLRISEVPVKGIEPLRILHISDIHFKGDTKYLEKVVRSVNEQDVDFVCMTGDLVEHSHCLDEALALLAQIRHPVYAVPGNHERWAGINLDRIDAVLRKTGGRLLVNTSVRVSHGCSLVGLDSMAGRPDLSRALEGTEETKRIFLFHEPKIVDMLAQTPFALALAGHSHGGQIRVPLLGRALDPDTIGPYDRGLFCTPGGPLYVTTGVGTWRIDARFFCRPEIAAIVGR